MRAASARLPLSLLIVVACATLILAKKPSFQPIRDAAHSSHQHAVKQAQSAHTEPPATPASVSRDLNADKQVLARFSKFIVDKTSGDSADEIVGASAASLYGSVGCSVCQAIAAPLSRALLSNASMNIITPIAEALCEMKHPQCNDARSCKDLCSQIVPEFAYEVVEIATETVLSPPYLCYLLKMCPAPPPPPPPTHFVPVPSNCSNHAGEHDWPSWKNTTGTGYFVQLSDIHVDLKYMVGAETHCGEPLCCREFDGPGSNSSDSAGLWGDYNCDLPINTFETLLSHIAELKPAPDFILYTGDDPPHDVWEQSRDWNLQAINELHALFTKYFPDIPVFSALGNHESFPVNQYEGPGGDSWLYDVVAHNWGSWLCDDAVATIRYAGYYTCRVRPGLRVISMNTNMWVSDNYWLLVNRTDAISHQFDWIVDVLKQARALNEKVIFIGHAVSSDWYEEFALQFVQIVDEFHDVIANQFYGHSHTSSLQLFYDNATGTIPINTAYIVGSLTPYTDLNPGWRLYSYDRDSLARATAPRTPPIAIKQAKPNSSSIRLIDDEDIAPFPESRPSFDDGERYTLVTDFTQYWLDLPEANRLNETDWSSHFYVATSAYNLSSPLTAAQWDEFADDLLTNPALYKAFSYNYYRGGPQAPESAQELSCEIQGPTAAAYSKCMQGHGIKGSFKPRPHNQC